jgi:Tol biopolymer transport system component
VDNSAPATTLVGAAGWMRGMVAPTSLSSDGKTLLIVNDLSGASDVLTLSLDATSTGGPSLAPRDFAASDFDERWAAFSPNGRFVAYTSNESGQDEVYVVAYPGPGGKSQVSRGGGTLPRWNRNGKELFYLGADKIMSVDVETSPNFRVLGTRALFGAPPMRQNRGFPYDVSPDGTRFLMLKVSSSTERPTELRVVINWMDELERMVPTGRH